MVRPVVERGDAAALFRREGSGDEKLKHDQEHLGRNAGIALFRGNGGLPCGHEEGKEPQGILRADPGIRSLRPDSASAQAQDRLTGQLPLRRPGRNAALG